MGCRWISPHPLLIIILPHRFHLIGLMCACILLYILLNQYRVLCSSFVYRRSYMLSFKKYYFFRTRFSGTTQHATLSVLVDAYWIVHRFSGKKIPCPNAPPVLGLPKSSHTLAHTVDSFHRQFALVTIRVIFIINRTPQLFPRALAKG